MSQGVETNNIAKFLTLPLIPTSTTHKITISTIIIDYSKFYIMTSYEYSAQLEQKARLKELPRRTRWRGVKLKR